MIFAIGYGAPGPQINADMGASVRHKIVRLTRPADPSRGTKRDKWQNVPECPRMSPLRRSADFRDRTGQKPKALSRMPPCATVTCHDLSLPENLGGRPKARPR